MSDSEGAVETKKGRGRPPADKSSVAPKKRARPESSEDKTTKDEKPDKLAVEDGESPSKRGRGRPKGTTKKINSGKSTGGKKDAKGRGRPKKKAKDESTEEDTEENEENDENESDS